MSLTQFITQLGAAGSGGSAGWIGSYELASGNMNLNEDFSGVCCTVSGSDIHAAFHSSTNARVYITKLDPDNGDVLINKSIRNATQNVTGFGRMSSANYSDWFMVADSIYTSNAGYTAYFFDAATYTQQAARQYSGYSNKGFVYAIHRSASSGYTHLIGNDNDYACAFVTGTTGGQSDRDNFGNNVGNGGGSGQSDTAFDGTYVYINLRDDVSDSQRKRQNIWRIQSSSNPTIGDGLNLLPTATSSISLPAIEVDGSNVYVAGGDNNNFIIYKVAANWATPSSSTITWAKSYATVSGSGNSVGRTTTMVKSTDGSYLYYVTGSYSGFTYQIGIWKVDASNGDLLGYKIIKDPNSVDRLFPVQAFVLDDGSLVVSGNRKDYTTSNPYGVVVKMDFDNVADGTYGEFEIASRTIPTATTPSRLTGNQNGSDTDSQTPSTAAISTGITTDTITPTVESF